ENGRILWNGLKDNKNEEGIDNKYYVREIAAPDGYMLNMNYISITQSKPEIYVYDRPGKELPEAGDMGTGVFYAIGTILLLSGIAFICRKSQRD
ncbi:MAG: LPXTG cell wall anchor domain-containing protein, partial [Oscillospiraceae bacterium]